jgi:hypothetical protein
MVRRLSWGGLLLIACIGTPGDLGSPEDIVLDDGGDEHWEPEDSGWARLDAGKDAGPSGHLDASVKETDAGTGRDASVPDASVVDASVPDASVPDASVPDASVPDASVSHFDAGPGRIPSGHSPGDARDPYHEHGGDFCARCHGSTLDGGSGRSCYTCHTNDDHSIDYEGVMHREGGDATCPYCHGPNSTGGLGPACVSCHP